MQTTYKLRARMQNAREKLHYLFTRKIIKRHRSYGSLLTAQSGTKIHKQQWAKIIFC